MLGRFDDSCPHANILAGCLWVLRTAVAQELPRIVHGEDRPFLVLVGDVPQGEGTSVKGADCGDFESVEKGFWSALGDDWYRDLKREREAGRSMSHRSHRNLMARDRSYPAAEAEAGVLGVAQRLMAWYWQGTSNETWSGSLFEYRIQNVTCMDRGQGW